MAEQQVNRLAFADFYNGSVQNDLETSKAGRPIFDDVEMIRIRWAGNTKNEFHAPANDRSDRPIIEPETNSKVWPKWKDHPDFLPAYEAFKRGQAVTLNGTPLSEWPALTEARRAELKALNIFTVDQMANLDPTAMKRLGQDGPRLKEQAVLFLERAAGAAVDAQHASEREEMQRQIDELRALVQGGASATAPATTGAKTTRKAAKAEPETPASASPFASWEPDDIRAWLKDADPTAPEPHHKTGQAKLVEIADETNARLQAAKKAQQLAAA